MCMSGFVKIVRPKDQSQLLKTIHLLQVLGQNTNQSSLKINISQQPFLHCCIDATATNNWTIFFSCQVTHCTWNKALIKFERKTEVTVPTSNISPAHSTLQARLQAYKMSSWLVWILQSHTHAIESTVLHEALCSLSLVGVMFPLFNPHFPSAPLLCVPKDFIQASVLVHGGLQSVKIFSN